jgi:protein phosphatase inhibitor 2
MAAHSPIHSPMHSPSSHAERPKGILKNSSYSGSPPRDVQPPSPPGQRPALGRVLSEKEIVLENTLRNAGPAHRRSSSNPRGLTSRRQSGASPHAADDNSPQLKWDEANLYINEQNRDSTMKIDEPKTPYAKQYDPTEDEEEIEMIDASELNVDELDSLPKRKKKTEDIPDFDLGEPSLDRGDAHMHDGEKRVLVEQDQVDEGYHGELAPNASQEEREKHRKFEQLRKKHYEMANVKDLLGHAEDEDDDDQTASSVPPMPNQQ